MFKKYYKIITVIIIIGQLVSITPKISADGNDEIALLEAGLSQKNATLGQEHPETVEVKENLADEYFQAGRYQDALRLYREILQTTNNTLDDGRLVVRDKIALCYYVLDDIDYAIYFAKETQYLRMYALSVNNPEFLAGLIAQADELYAVSDYENAIEIYQKVILLKIDILEKYDDEILNIMDKEANCYQKLGYYKKSTALFKEILMHRSSIGGKTHPDTLSSMNNLAVAYQLSGNDIDAYKLFADTIDLQKQFLGENDARTLLTINNLANLHYKNDEFTEAKTLYEKILKATKYDDFESIHTMHGLALTYEKLKNPNKALELYEKAIKKAEEFRISLTNDDKDDWLKNQFKLALIVPMYKSAITLMLKQNLPSKAFNIAEMCKARSLLERLSGKFDTAEKILLKLRLKTVQVELKDLERRETNDIPKGAIQLADLYERIDKAITPTTWVMISLRKATLRSRLSDMLDKLAKLTLLASAADAKRILPPDTAFISYVRHDDQITAFVSDNGGQVTAINLGDDKIIFELASDYLPLLDIKGNSIINEKKNKQLSDKLITPLLPYLKDKTNWIISPDSFLAALPFETLCLSGQFIIKNSVENKNIDINYIHSLSMLDIVIKRDNIFTGFDVYKKEFLGIGDPRYWPEKDTKKDNNNNDNKRLKGYTPIPASKEEVENISALFPAHDTYLDDKASVETIIKLNNEGTLSQYKYILFATHSDIDYKNPINTSLVLSLKDNKPGKHGYLTMEEIVKLKLNSQLVFLSACETGLGREVDGEGILGLPFAFCVAGNKNTIMTLWAINDKITAKFSESFFKKLSAGNKQVFALNQTKREFIDQGYSPKYWAPFVLYGY